MSECAVRLSGVTKRFGNVTAVDSLDLNVLQGSIHGFIGPNGSGKTTTIRMILRIFDPDDGRLEVLGQESGTCADDRIGYLPEERGLYRRMKVRDLLTYYARLKGHYDCQTDITNWLEKLGAADWGSRRIDGLSKGMSQKVQFMAAVVARPRLLILDEPFSGLDPVNLEVLRNAILELRSQGTTIIFSTHDMDVAERLCDTVFMICEGRKVLDGSIDEIQRQYPADQIKVRLAEGQTIPDRLPAVESAEKEGAHTILTLSDPCRTNDVLNALVSCAQVEHFELLRPSLHNIFVRIAQTGGTP
ncbi:MAG: ATP-binding cassette domain-containing protein [Planctomycetaceae bacterium]